MMDEYLKKVGKNIKLENIKLVRKSEKISQEKLAEKIGVSRNYIGMIERGEINVPTKTLIILAKALNVHPKIFLDI